MSLEGKKQREEFLKLKVKELNDITNSMIEQVRLVLGSQKAFGRSFIYDGMDYINVIVNEMRQIKKVMNKCGINLDNCSSREKFAEDKPSEDRYSIRFNDIGIMD
eukprot:CAMPEP_0170555364 /NCGR_PEP_ID=MMETSP0211-20121228/13264_1 /TAXON_ID=311385 /ORGANISM="Pseudokeronopsis sp., Strain OXSARD2" /LENGTH=104 /DNA_ID=CAMNT_0010865153 /DNA_START=543 /DNA_END=857 /DNA_ORIENTATION=+